MSEQTQPEIDPNEEQRIANINDKQYLYDSLDKESQGAFQQALEIGNKIEAKKVEIRDLNYAREYLVNFLSHREEGFTEVAVKAEEVAEAPVKKPRKPRKPKAKADA